MKKVILLLAIVLYNACSFAQEACGFDHFLSEVKRDSTSGSDFDSLRVYIRRQIATNKEQMAAFRTQPNNYVIPVVFHLVGTNTSTLTDAYVVAQLNLLNDGFANALGSTYGSIADDAQIKFCLAQTLPNGQPWANITAYNPNLFYNTTAGITRCTTTAANTIAGNHNMNATGANSQQALVNIAYSGFAYNRYLNIWVVEQISLSQVPTPYVNSVLGYAPFPILGPAAYLDGVVMRMNGFGIGSGSPNYNQGRILIHEVGHYLGLFHTFQFGCSEVINGTPCSSSGDECCDTPPVAVPNQTTCASLSASPPNSCSESPNLADMYENHMDYAYDQPGSCRNTFTEDQADRMHATIQLYRPNLVSFANHIATGLTQPTGCQAGAIDPTFITDLAGGSQQLCTGDSIGFMAGSGASSYSWLFPGATPSSTTGTNNPTGILYSTPGTYNVSLNITDGLGNNYSSMMQIFVSNCTPYSGNRANWYFSSHSSVSFATGMAVAQAPSSIQGHEASAAISDNTGNLLFYTDSRSVWNNTHATMTNGNNTLNGSPNSGSFISNSQGALIVPRPGTTDHYYIYTQSDVDLPTNILGLSQYEVDMGTPGGMVLSTTPVIPTDNYANHESVVAIPHCNGTDYWVVVKPKNNTQSGLLSPGPLSTINQYLASYLVTNAGISNTPVLSLSAPYTPTVVFAGNTGISQMAVSPDKKLFCIGDLGTNIGYLYYFDCATGLFNYLATLPNTGYGIAFSPNSKVLYCKNTTTIRQYDLTNISECQNTPPFIDFQVLPVGYTTPIFGHSSMQLGPDGRIYTARAGFPSFPQGFIGAINFPNAINSTPTSNECGYNFSAIPLLVGQSCWNDLPNDIIGGIGAPPDDFSFCIKNCGQACFTSLGCGTTFAWDFGDGYSTSGTNTVIPAGTNAGTTSGNFEYPCHTYASPGSYVVSLSIDGNTAVTHTVTITLPSPPTITGPLCPVTGVQQSYFGPAGFTYSWTASNASPTSGNAQTFNTTWITLPASLTLTVTDPNTGCTATSTMAISTSSSTTVTISPATSTICAGATQTLCASGAASYTWSTGANTSCITVSPGAPLTTYTVTGNNGSCGTGTATANVYTIPGPQICLSSSLTVCSNTCTVLNGICDDTDLTTVSYTWSPPAGLGSVYSGSTTACPKVTTVYTLTATNLAGCTTVATTTLFVLTAPTVTIAPATSTICSGSTQTLCASGATTYTWSTGANTTCIIETPVVTTIYTVTGTSANTNCSATASATIVVNPRPRMCLTPSLTICAGSCTVINAACQGSTDSYTWSPSTGLGTPFSGSTTACPTVSTVYTVTAVNSYGCIRTATVGITVTPIPTVAISPSTSTICAGSSQTLCASGAGTYTWSTASTNTCIIVTPSTTTVYTVTGGNGNCTAVKTATVYVTPTPTVAITPLTSTICVGASQMMCASVGLTTYTWSTGATSACITVSPGSTTVYTVTGTKNGCLVTPATATVYVNPKPIICMSPTVTICSGTCTVIRAKCDDTPVGTTYTWTPITGLGSPNSGTSTACPTVTTVYSVTVTGPTGCTATSATTVFVIPTPTVLISPSTSTICAGSSQTLCASGASTYTWSTASTNTCIVVTPSTTTVYTVTGSNGACKSAIKTATVYVTPTPTVAITPLTSTICAGASQMMCASAGLTTYTWSTGGTSACITVSPVSTTVYTVTGMKNGCLVAPGSATVYVNPKPIICMSPSSTLCAGTCTVISGKCGGLAAFTSYQWTPTVGLTAPTSISTTACPTVTTVYTLTATNFLTGCSTTGTVLVAMSPATIAISGPTSVVCGTSNLYSVSPVITNPTTLYTWSATNATPASGSGTSASISFTSPGGVITWNASTTLPSGAICKVKATYTVSCHFGPHFPEEKMTGGGDVTVYPNPNTGIMTLAYSIDQDAVFEILDANNKVIARYDVDAKGKEMIIRQEELTNGVYLYKLSVKDRVIKAGKIVIIR